MKYNWSKIVNDYPLARMAAQHDPVNSRTLILSSHIKVKRVGTGWGSIDTGPDGVAMGWTHVLLKEYVKEMVKDMDDSLEYIPPEYLAYLEGDKDANTD